MTSRRFATPVFALAVATLAALSGCSANAPAPASSGSSSTPSSAGSTTPSAAPAAPGPKACELVTEAIVQAAYGFDPGTGTEKAGFGGSGSTECDYGTKVIVQVSLQADLYYPKSAYSKAGVPGSQDPDAAAGVDRGYVASEAVLVVKGQTGVFVTVTQNVGIAANQALAKAVGAGLS